MKFDRCNYIIKKNNIWRYLHSIYISVQLGQNCAGSKEEAVVAYFVLLFQINWGAVEPIKSLVFSTSIARITPRSSGYDLVF